MQLRPQVVQTRQESCDFTLQYCHSNVKDSFFFKTIHNNIELGCSGFDVPVSPVDSPDHPASV